MTTVILGKCQDCGRYVYAYPGLVFRLHQINGRYVYIHDCGGKAMTNPDLTLIAVLVDPVGRLHRRRARAGRLVPDHPGGRLLAAGTQTGAQGSPRDSGASRARAGAPSRPALARLTPEGRQDSMSALTDAEQVRRQPVDVDTRHARRAGGAPTAATRVVEYRFGLPYKARCGQCGQVEYVHHAGTTRELSYHYLSDKRLSVDYSHRDGPPMCQGGGMVVSESWLPPMGLESQYDVTGGI